MRRLGCCDHSFPAVPHELAIDLISQLGFDSCDLMLHGGRFHLRPEVVRDDIPGWAGRLDERVRGRGLGISDVFLIPWTDFKTMAANHPVQEERSRGRALFRDILALTARLGVNGMTTLPGIDWSDESHEDSLNRAAAEFRERVNEASALGVKLSVEPHVGSVCESPSDAARLCELAPGLALTLDYSHVVRQGLPEADADPLLNYTRHFHVRGAADHRLQAPLSENTIDYERILDVMDAVDYSGCLSLEYLAEDSDDVSYVDVLSETVLMRDRLRAKLTGQL